MEIQGNSPTPMAIVGDCRDTRPADAGAAGSGEAAGERAADAGAARIDLSERARGMLAIKQAVDAAPDAREAHVADLRDQLEAGTYNVRGKLIAAALVRNALVEAVA